MEAEPFARWNGVVQDVHDAPVEAHEVGVAAHGGAGDGNLEAHLGDVVVAEHVRRAGFPVVELLGVAGVVAA